MSSGLTSVSTLFLLAAKSPHAHHGVLSFFRHLGMLGLFFTSIVDSSFVPLPIPGVTDIMLIVYAAAKSNAFMLVAIATVGSALGGFFSHAAGQAGGMKFLEKHVPERILKRVTTWMETHSILSVALPAILPPPMPLSPFVLVAGAVHMSRKKFMVAFTVSRFIRHSIAVWLGVRYGHQVIHLWQKFSAKWATTILVVLWTVILVFTVIGIWKIYKTSREMDLTPGKRRTGKPVATEAS
jgi:membrane protein YqaA with SNARE-associated domain